MHWFYHAGMLLVRASLVLASRWEITGGENVPPEGPLLVIVNHLSLADPPLIGASINRKMVFMAKEELFRPAVTGYIMRSFGAFPVGRDRADRAALRRAAACLKQGMALVMFPEGRRSRSCQLQPGQPGCALIAARSGAAILPVGVSGTERIKGWTWWLRRPRLSVNIGPPFHLPQVDNLTRAELARLTGIMMRRLAAVLPPEYRGEYRVDDADRESQDGVLFRSQAGA